MGEIDLIAEESGTLVFAESACARAATTAGAAKA